MFSPRSSIVTYTELETNTASTNADIKMLTAQTSGSAEHLNGYLQRTEAMENHFQERVATAFAGVESELSETKDVAQCVHNAGADAGNAAPTASHQIA